MRGHDLAVCRGEGRFPVPVCVWPPHLGENKFTSTLSSSGLKNGDLFFFHFFMYIYLLTSCTLPSFTFKKTNVFHRHQAYLRETVVQCSDSTVKLTFQISAKELLGEDMLLRGTFFLV